MLLSNILSLFNTRQHAQYVCVIPCHRVSVCWWESPVAAIVSEKAGRLLYELIHTAPRERKTKTEREIKRGTWWGREGRLQKPKRRGKWREGEEGEKRFQQIHTEAKKTFSRVCTQKHQFTRKYNLCEKNETALTDEHWCNLITLPGKTGSVPHYIFRNYITVAGFLKIALLLLKHKFPCNSSGRQWMTTVRLCVWEEKTISSWESPVHCSKHTHVKIVAKQPHPVTNSDGNMSTSARQAKIHYRPGVQ